MNLRLFNTETKEVAFEGDFWLVSGWVAGARLGNNEDMSKYVLLRSTGLYDKNGKEIFESDIIKENFENEMHSFAPGFGRIMWCQKCAAFHAKLSYQTDEDPNGYSIGTDSEVVGNLYQNPELMQTTV